MVRFDRGIRNLLEEAFEAGHKFSYDADNEAPDFENWLKQKSAPDAAVRSAAKDIREDQRKRKDKKFWWW